MRAGLRQPTSLPGWLPACESRTPIVTIGDFAISAQGSGITLDLMQESFAMQKITPFLWFDHQAEEAMNFYVSIFKNSKVLSVNRYGEGAPMPKDTVMTANFELDGQTFTALNGGPIYTFSPAISFVVHCETQEEVDEYWQKLSAEGKENQCAWLEDKFGVSWQIVPNILIELLSDPDPAKAGRVMQAMLGMKKIDIAGLKQAYERQ